MVSLSPESFSPKAGLGVLRLKAGEQNGSEHLLTYSFAVFGQGVHLVTLVAFTFIVSLVVNADLATGIRILTFIYVWKDSMKIISKSKSSSSGERMSLD